MRTDLSDKDRIYRFDTEPFMIDISNELVGSDDLHSKALAHLNRLQDVQTFLAFDFDVHNLFEVVADIGLCIDDLDDMIHEMSIMKQHHRRPHIQIDPHLDLVVELRDILEVARTSLEDIHIQATDRVKKTDEQVQN